MNENKNEDERSHPCHVGGCERSTGMCPGIALIIAMLTGAGVQALTGQDWLGFALGILVALTLILGFYPGGGLWPWQRSRKS